jgi:hypothetical protein
VMPLSPLLSCMWQASLQLLTPNKGNSKMNTKTPAKIEMSVFIHHQLCHCNQHINDLQQRVVPSSQQNARQLDCLITQWSCWQFDGILKQ